MLGFKEFKDAVMESALNENVTPKVYNLDKTDSDSIVKNLNKDQIFNKLGKGFLYLSDTVRSVMINSQDGQHKDKLYAIKRMGNEWNAVVNRGASDLLVPLESYGNGTITVIHK
jgi:hypothetical protein